MKSKYREDRNLGPVHQYLGPEVFVEDDSSVVLCKSGQVGIVLRIAGVDPSCADSRYLEMVSNRWRNAIKQFTPDFEIRQWSDKRPYPEIPAGPYEYPEVERLAGGRAAQVRSCGADLYSVDLHTMLLLDTPLHDKKNPSVLASSLSAACSQLRFNVDSFIQHVKSDIALCLLDKDETYNFFRTLVNLDSSKLAYYSRPADIDLSYAACDSRVNLIWEDERHKDPYLRIEHEYAKVMTLKLLPATTDQNMLSRLHAIPCNCLLASSWRAEDPAITLGYARWAKNRWWSRAKGQTKDDTKDPGLIDASNLDDATQLNNLIYDVEQRGVRYGKYSLYGLLWGDEQKVHAGMIEASKVFQMSEGSFLPDHQNQRGYLSMLPGNRFRNKRIHDISDEQYADLSAIFSLDCGSVVHPHLQQEYFSIFTSKPPDGMQGVKPYFFNPVDKDVQHMIVDGSTGSGKTVWLKMYIANGQKYNPSTIIFDTKNSFEHLTRRFGGSYVSFADRNIKLNPLLLPPTEENIQFQTQIVQLLLEAGEGKLTPEDKERLHRSIVMLSSQPPKMKRLSILQNMLRLELRDALSQWVGSGQYAWVFDNEEDTLTIADWQAFSFQGMESYKPVQEPLFFYVDHRTRQTVHNPEQRKRFKMLVYDEAWSMIKHPMIFARMEDAVRTYRDKNAALVVCTQRIEDLPKIFLECPIRIFLRHSTVDRKAYEEIAKLPPAAIDELEKLESHGEFLYSASGKHRVLRFTASNEVELPAYA